MAGGLASGKAQVNGGQALPKPGLPSGITASGSSRRGTCVNCHRPHGWPDAANPAQKSTLNDLPLGRNVEEALRLLDAIDFTNQHGEVCPANWKKGDKAMTPTFEGLKAFSK